MKVAILSITADRNDLSKVLKKEILDVYEVDENEYFSTLVDIAMEEFNTA